LKVNAVVAPNRARMMNTAICPRVTESLGQYCVAEQPAVIPRSRIFWIHLKKGWETGTSVK
jgi:hypothetical protein